MNTSPLMQEEIFGPILPVLTFKHMDEVIPLLKKKEKPLTMYIFAKNRKTINM